MITLLAKATTRGHRDEEEPTVEAKKDQLLKKRNERMMYPRQSEENIARMWSTQILHMLPY